MTAKVVISLFDFTGNAVREWAAAGFDCYCFDIKHSAMNYTEKVGSGSITFCWADLTPKSPSYKRIRKWAKDKDIVQGFTFPPCTDMAGSGALHWAGKALKNPSFQTDAAYMASYSFEFIVSLGAECILENPVGALTKLWRKWDWTFDPYMFGGYLPANDKHPRWDKYIAPRDAYPKKTCIWATPGVVWPKHKPVEPEVIERTSPSGKVIRGSRQTMYLGGKSDKTKSIRDETPRGFARAFFLANHQKPMVCHFHDGCSRADYHGPRCDCKRLGLAD